MIGTLSDYVLLDKKFIKILKNVHEFKGEAAGMSVYFLIEVKFKIVGGCSKKVKEINRGKE